MVTVWEQTKTLCNTYLKSEEHLQLREKEIVSQASQADVVHATSAAVQLVACQLKLQPTFNFCSCSHHVVHVMTREPEEAMLEALLEALGDVQGACFGGCVVCWS